MRKSAPPASAPDDRLLDAARPAEASEPRSRRRYVDWARAIAVLVMIQAHTADSWLRVGERSTLVFRDLMVLGGLAAPLFLWLAGLGIVLSAESKARSGGGTRRAATRAICRRGFEIFALAFLFRLQSFILSPGSPAVTLLRVDILNVMGPAIVAAGLVWGAIENATVLTFAYALLAAAAALITPVIRAAEWVSALPVLVQWYLRPTGDHTTFTTFPWAGFVFAGGAAGVLMSRARDPQSERRLNVGLAAAGAATVAAGYYSAFLPTIYRASSFWTSSPTYFAIRVGIMMLAIAALYFIEVALQRTNLRLTPLARLGRSSLFVYWIHVELVYGNASRFLHRHLSLWEWAAAYVVFCLAMYGAVVLRDRVVEAWRGRGQQFLAVQPKIGSIDQKKPLR